MNRIRLMLLVGLCIFIALLGIGYVTVGMKDDKEPATLPVTTAPESTTLQNVVPVLPTDENSTSEVTTVEETDGKTTAAQETTTGKAVTDYEYAYAGFNPSVAAVDSKNWEMLLVNQSYILPDGYNVKTSTVTGGSQSLDYRVAPHYNKMVEAAKTAGISLIPVSGYRTYERQEANFNRKINYYTGLGYSKAEATRLAAKIVLMPGTSEHNAGLAMDFGTNGNTTLDENFGNTDAYKWLSKHAAEYGFILRYPEDKTEITKVTYEPWHWRYVGAENAQKIKESGLTLEEYLGLNA